MSSPRNYQTEAIIIKRVKLGEADKILTLYTPHSGKIQAVAKGVRRPKSKLAGHLELLTHSQIWLARGRNLDTVTGAQTITSFLPLKSDLWLTSCALYITELANQFTADHIENSPLFKLLLETLEHLCEDSDKELVLRYYEINMLSQVGYRPQLEHCVLCNQALMPTTNSFSSAAGGMLCSNCAQSEFSTRPLSVNTLKVLRFLQNNDWTVSNRLKVDQTLSRGLEAVMKDYLRYLLEREVKSAAWLDTLREQRSVLTCH